MATRLYVNTAATCHAEPDFAAGWDYTTGAYRRRLEPTLESLGSLTTLTTSKANAGPSNHLIVQLVSLPLAAQTISGYVKGQFRFSESSAALDAGVQTIVKVWRPSTASIVGTLLAHNNYAGVSAVAGAVGYEVVATTLTNRKVPSGWSGTGDALTSTDVLDGDLLVVEIGYRQFEAAVTSRSASLTAGQVGSAGDLPEDETTTSSTYNGWLEFSGTITFSPRVTVIKNRVIYPMGRNQAVQNTAGQLWPRGNRGV